MCGHSSRVLSDDEGLQIPQHVACRSTQDLLFSLQSAVTRQPSRSLTGKTVGRLFVSTLHLLEGKLTILCFARKPQTRGDGGQVAPPTGLRWGACLQQSNSPSLRMSRRPLLDPGGGSAPIGSDNTSPTPAVGAGSCLQLLSRVPGVSGMRGGEQCACLPGSNSSIQVLCWAFFSRANTFVWLEPSGQSNQR